MRNVLALVLLTLLACLAAPVRAEEPLPTLGGPPTPTGPCPFGPVGLDEPRPPHGHAPQAVEDFGWADWQAWWEHNLGPYESLTWRMHHVPLGPTPLFGGTGGRAELAPRIHREVERMVLPALLRLLEPDVFWSTSLATRFDALLSLGKLAQREEHVRVILHWARRGRASARLGKGRALLALGLLRRTHPDDQFAAELLDEVRQVLFEFLERSTVDRPSGSAAAIALGLLGDQPTVGGLTGHRRHVARLYAVVEAAVDDPGTTPAVLLAIGHQEAAVFTAWQRERLRTLAWKGTLGRRTAAREVVDWATWALGRVGTADDLSTLRRLIQRPRFSTPPQRWCAALGLGALGRELGGDSRKTAARALRDCLLVAKEGQLRGLLLIGLGQTLEAAAKAQQHDVYEPWVAHAPLLEALRRDPGASRGYAALAVGCLAHALGEHPPRERDRRIRAKVLEALGDALRDGRHPRTQAAAAIALGLTGDHASRTALEEAVADEHADPRVAPAAAWGLGLLRGTTKRTALLLTESAQTVMYGRLRQRSHRALALLGHPLIAPDAPDAVGLLLRDLATSRSEYERCEALELLGRFGDVRALEPLLQIVASKERTGREQVAAVRALGCIGDLDLEPALDRLRQGTHYRSRTAQEFTCLP